MIYPVSVNGINPENAYFYIDDDSSRGFIIDPGARGRALYALAKEHGFLIEGILVTHGHFDHIGGIEGFTAAWEEDQEGTLPIYIGEEGKKYLTDPYWNLSEGFSPSMTVTGDVRYLKDGETVSLSNGALCLRYIHTPGHTEDSGIYVDDRAGEAFVGDTIFADGGYGNFRFPGGDLKVLLKSIRERILTLPEGTKLYSGHSGPTTVGDERKFYTFSS